MKNVFLIFLIFFPFYSHAQNIFKWQGYILENNKNPIPFAAVQVFAKNKYYIFSANVNGELKMQYENFQLQDTIQISSIGYHPLKVTISNLINVDTLFLEQMTYNLDEITVRPKIVKYIKYGNLNEWSYHSVQFSFDAIFAIYIPYNNVDGRIIKVRVYMHDFAEKDWKVRPFRLRLFDGSKVAGKELIKNELIASLEPKDRHWVEIDLTAFKLEMPKTGIFVGIQALSAQYYKENGYIEKTTIKQGKYTRVNSLSIGSTKKHKSGLDIQVWRYYNEVTGWTQKYNSEEYPMIQLIIEPYE